MGDRRRTGAAGVLGAVVLLVLAALGAASSWGEVFRSLPADPSPPEAPQEPTEPVAETPLPDIEDMLPGDAEPLRIPDWVTGLVMAVAVITVIAFTVWIVVKVVTTLRKPGLRHASEASGVAEETPEIDHEEVALSLDETLRRLRSGTDVDDAIVTCWRRLEAIAADSGIRRETAQTSEEFTVEILARAVVDDAALADLAGLYRQALFSTHVLTDAHRERAIDCVERLAVQMGAYDAQ